MEMERIPPRIPRPRFTPAAGFHEYYEFQPFLFEVLPNAYSICRLTPQSVQDVAALFSPGVISVTRTDKEISCVCIVGHEPENALAEKGWRAIRIAEKVDFGLIGIIGRITTLWAIERISVCVISTYDTDYFFVKETQLDAAIQVLREAQYEVNI